MVRKSGWYVLPLIKKRILDDNGKDDNMSEQYVIVVPDSIVEELGITGDMTAVLVYVEEPKWYMLLDWGNDELLPLWKRLPLHAKMELCEKKLAGEELCRDIMVV